MHQLTQLAGDLHRQRPARTGQPPSQRLLARSRATGQARSLLAPGRAAAAPSAPPGGCAQLETQAPRAH